MQRLVKYLTTLNPEAHPELIRTYKNSAGSENNSGTVHIFAKKLRLTCAPLAVNPLTSET